MSSSPDVARNLATADRLVRVAAADGAAVVVLPEKWTVYGDPDAERAHAEPLDGPAVGWARALAAELGIDLVAGSLVERVPGEDLLRNTSVHVDPEGEVKAVYRKIHLFDVDVEGTAYRESDTQAPGEEIVLTHAADGTAMGMSVCYDVRFPELYRILTVRGARILLVPSAFTVPTTHDHWATLLRARAIENQAFVVAPNQWGAHTPTLRSGGRSLIVDPWGLVLAQCADGEGHVVADLDFAAQDRIRRDLPALTHRRAETYVWHQKSIA